VRIKVRAAGMNPMDRSIASGVWASRFDAAFPLIMGVDVAGTIETAGENAARFALGDEVFGQLVVPAARIGGGRTRSGSRSPRTLMWRECRAAWI
jgi:NADPH:quinone reductase-like Zn-dependent oxidoreductase